MNNEQAKENTINWASGLNVIAGIWLFIATWALSSQMGVSRNMDLIFGIIVFVLSIVRLSARSQGGWASWLNVIAGIWLIIAPFACGYQSGAQEWNSVIVGIIVAILGIVSGSTGATRHHPSGTPA